MPSRILVTGGAGFIGSHTCERLVDLGHWVLCVDNFDELFYPRSVKARNLRNLHHHPHWSLLEADICDRNKMEDAFQKFQPEIIVHLAALAGVVPSLDRPQEYLRVNVEGTLVLLELARRYQASHFVFASSSSVYGERDKAPFSEEDPTSQPLSPYGATKKMGEVLAFTYHHLYGLPVTCLRIFTVYGPRQRPDLAIHKFARCLLKDQPLPLYGDGSSQRDYTFITDLVDALVAAAEQPMGFEIINVGSGRPITLMDMVQTLETLLGKKGKLEFLPMPPSDPTLTHADISKAQRLLGYRPQVPFEEGVRQFVHWLLDEIKKGYPL
ncbi:MAG: GDP-mannose 4,6-dehydratase [Armatimonadetes bacterium]|nr:GDP-mannose 4,6-dehydratase [Armatimonadota bacterium]MDW8120906.1 GDP-mannose 4,6-dehydratase [Armatimonadota bacterium]